MDDAPRKSRKNVSAYSSHRYPSKGVTGEPERLLIFPAEESDFSSVQAKALMPNGEQSVEGDAALSGVP